MTYEEAVALLRPAVKESHLEDQRHIDLTVLPAGRRGEARRALMWARAHVARGRVSEERLKRDLGIE